MGFVATAINGVVFGNGVCSDGIEPGFYGGIDSANDGGLVRLLCERLKRGGQCEEKEKY
jgi:hypothetical protein